MQQQHKGTRCVTVRNKYAEGWSWSLVLSGGSNWNCNSVDKIQTWKFLERNVCCQWWTSFTFYVCLWMFLAKVTNSDDAIHPIWAVSSSQSVFCLLNRSLMLLGPLFRREWSKAREQKVVFPVLAEDWSSSAPNWCSDQRGLWAEEPAAPSNTVILGMPGCNSCPSWLMTSSFDPLPWVLTSTSVEQEHTQKLLGMHIILQSCTSEYTCSHGAEFNEWFSEVGEAEQRLCLDRNGGQL